MATIGGSWEKGRKGREGGREERRLTRKQKRERRGEGRRGGGKGEKEEREMEVSHCMLWKDQGHTYGCEIELADPRSR